MEEIQEVLVIISIIGIIIISVNIIFKKSNALTAAGSMFALPCATYNLITENKMLNTILFVLVLLAGLNAIHHLSKNEK